MVFFSNQSDCPLRVTKERAVCADKIMFSDLRSQQLRKTMEIKSKERQSVENTGERSYFKAYSGKEERNVLKS